MKYISRESFLFYNETNFERFISLMTDRSDDSVRIQCNVSDQFLAEPGPVRGAGGAAHVSGVGGEQVQQSGDQSRRGFR